MPVIIDEHTQYFNNGAAIVNGFVYIGKLNTDPTILANRLALFSDAGLTTQVPNPQRTNARGQTLDGPIFTAEGSFSFELQNSGSVVIESILAMGASPGGLSLIPLFDVDGINSITAKGDSTVATYIDKQQYSLTLINDPTGAMTLDIDGVGVVPIRKNGLEIQPDQLLANQLIVVAFNSIGPVFELVSGISLSSPGPIGDETPNTVKAKTFEGNAGGTTINEFSTDGTLAGNSDDAVPTEKAVKTFVGTAFLPTGASITFRGSTAPSGYVFEDGTAYNSVADTSFADLFTAIGTTYGGTGASNFNVPDTRGRVDIALDNLGGSSANIITNAQADILGGTGGSYPFNVIGNISTGIGGETVINSNNKNDQPWLAATKIIKK